MQRRPVVVRDKPDGHFARPAVFVKGGNKGQGLRSLFEGLNQLGVENALVLRRSRNWPSGVWIDLPRHQRRPFLAKTGLDQIQGCLQFPPVIRNYLEIFSGKLPQAFIEGRSFDLGLGKEIIRYEPVKYNQVVDKDLEFNLEMIIIYMYFGNIACILSPGEVDPVGICRKTNEPAKED